MKILLNLLLVTGMALSFSSCGSNKSDNSNEVTTAQFACPMDCENGKVYNKKGECPVCEMDLVEIQ